MTMHNVHKTRAFDRAPRRQEAFRFICDEIAAGRPFPTPRQIDDYMGWKNANSATDCLHSLARFDKVINLQYFDGKCVWSLPK
jgi:hypothetical protein